MENLVVWFEIPVTDMERAKRFYSEVFKLNIEVQDLGDKPYGFFPMRGYGNSGALVKHMDFQPSAKAATIYLNAGRDLSEPLSRVEAAGGKILVPKTMISKEMGYYALFLDSEGNRVGLHSMSYEQAKGDPLVPFCSLSMSGLPVSTSLPFRPPEA